MQNTTTNFNPREHLMQIKNKGGASDYLPVQWRLVWFREQCPDGTISTELVHMDLDKEVESEVMQWDNDTKRMKSVTKHGYGVAVFKATITDGHGGSATGFGSEKASDFGDFLEKAETKSIGRALAALGYGTQFAPELNEEHRIVDSPVVTPSSVDKLRTEWAIAYNIADNQIEERWPKFIAYVLGRSVSEPDLQPIQITKIGNTIDQQRGKKAS